jgi:hypothetical protein
MEVLGTKDVVRDTCSPQNSRVALDAYLGVGEGDPRGKAVGDQSAAQLPGGVPGRQDGQVQLVPNPWGPSVDTTSDDELSGAHKVRRTPRWPRKWANFSLF